MDAGTSTFLCDDGAGMGSMNFAGMVGDETVYPSATF